MLDGVLILACKGNFERKGVVQDRAVKFDFIADRTGTGNRSEEVIK